tara:strand:- start:3123 stop:3377 length:255 start_codon:yes stop_codon:yes gene_type:complete
MVNCEQKVLAALKKRMRVTRKTAIQRGWCENLTATISNLRDMGHNIQTVKAKHEDGSRYTRYRYVRGGASWLAGLEARNAPVFN